MSTYVTYVQTITDPAEGQLDIHEFRSYDILVDGKLATIVVSESPWRIADAWRADGEVTVIWHLRREFRNVDGEVVRTEERSKAVTR